jgi:putative transposase
VRHQCELLDLCRSSYYYQCCPETEENLALMRRLDELHLEPPVYGSRKLAVSLRREGLAINRKRVVRLLRLMGIEAIYAKPKTSLPAPGHQIYPYLLRDLVVTGPDQVWCADITYVPMARGFMYLVAVMDWWSRYVLGWRLRGCLRGGAAGGTAGAADFQHRPRLAVHLADVYRRGGIGGRGREHGWSGAVDRQSVYRTAVAERQI